MSRLIEFIPGYYEWHLIIDDVLVWVEGDDILENMSDIQGQYLYSDLEATCEDICNYIRSNLATHLSLDFECDEEQVISILSSLTDSEWDLVCDTMTRVYAYHYGIYDRRFEFKGHTFEAVGNILGGWKTREEKIIDDQNSPIEKADHLEFYEVAKKNKLSCDVYRIDWDFDNYYMSCGGIFRAVKIDDDFKVCDKYKNRYHSKA